MNDLKWEKLGLLLEPDKDREWLATRAGASCVVPIDKNGLFRVYITGKDYNNRSRIGIAFLDLNTLELSDVSENPVIDLGERGTFDENGTSYPFVLPRDKTYFMYYVGWVVGVQVPWYNGLGLAISSDGVNFNKFSKAPLLERDQTDYLGIGSMCILEDQGILKMWYSRFESWGKNNYDHKHYYHIKYAESLDGLKWNRFDKICIDFKDKTFEYAIAKPSVLKLNGRYYMWYSYRGNAYAIGFAVSDDGKTWRRYDELAGIEYSREGWDSEMQCYAYVFEYGDKIWMLYNGNNYGSSGLGLASLSTKDFIRVTKDL
jgi:predicted GH43/DUF377 family glycosyl hydrolase